jgi:hypothetical protein
MSEQFVFDLQDPTKTDAALARLAEALGLRTKMGKAALNLAVQNVKLLDSKQLDYGSGNISAFGEYGVLVRASDKIERLKNLSKSPGKPNHESVRDTWMDLSNYGLIGALCHEGVWPA